MLGHGMILLDAIIQSLVPDEYKMDVRTIFRQNDNNEIKGYDFCKVFICVQGHTRIMATEVA